MNTFQTKRIKRARYWGILSLLFLFCTICLPIGAQISQNSKITIKVQNEQLTNVFKKISQLSDYKFSMMRKLFKMHLKSHLM